MPCPSIADLPAAPPGRLGWPWTEDTPRLPERMPDGHAWPRVSIVTPSLNQGMFLEETIRSVLLQGYPDLEYFIFDGGSHDQSVDIIAKYQPWLSHWISQPDGGQSEAINKGWQMSSGEVLAWLNADDLYTPGALGAAAKALSHLTAMAYSDFERIDKSSRSIGRYLSRSFSLTDLVTTTNYIPQPTVFIHREVVEAVGLLDESLRFAMDLDYWLRVGLKFGLADYPPPGIQYLSGDCLARFRLHPDSKSARETLKFRVEWADIWNRFFSLPDLPPEAAAVKPEAYAYLHYQLTLACLGGRQFRTAISHLKACRQSSPAYLLKQPGQLLRLPLQALRAFF